MGDRSVEADALLFPPLPRVDADAVAASYHGWQRGFTEIRTDNELFNLAIDRSAGDLRLLVNDGPGPGRAIPRGRRAVVHDPVRPRLDHRLVPGAGGPAAARGRDARGPRPAPGDGGRPVAGRGARQDPPRAAHGRDGPRGRAAAPALLRHGRRDAAVARAVRRDVGLDRRPGARRSAVAERARARSSGSTSTATATATGSSSTSAGRRAASSTRAGRTRTTGSATGTGNLPSRRSPSPRSRATCSTPSAGWPRSPGSAARGARRPPGAARPRPCASGSRRRSGSEDQRFYAMALDGEKRQADAIGSNAGHCLWTGIVVARAGARRSSSG